MVSIEDTEIQNIQSTCCPLSDPALLNTISTDRHTAFGDRLTPARDVRGQEQSRRKSHPTKVTQPVSKESKWRACAIAHRTLNNVWVHELTVMLGYKGDFGLFPQCLASGLTTTLSPDTNWAAETGSVVAAVKQRGAQTGTQMWRKGKQVRQCFGVF